MTPFLQITLVGNQGAAFSFLASASGWQHYFFIALALCVSAGLLVWLLALTVAAQGIVWGIGFIIGGALGNVMDRIHYGYVIDFIDLHVGYYHWPVFNLADSAITLGVISILFLGRLHDR